MFPTIRLSSLQLESHHNSGESLDFTLNRRSSSEDDNEKRRTVKVKSVAESEHVYALEFLGCRSCSINIDTAQLMSSSCSPASAGRIGIRKSSSGNLRPVQKIGGSWLRSVKLSPDVYSHNAILELTNEKTVRLRLWKNIAAGEEIVMWFSEEVAILMNIPFLAPVNIVDNKCYTCHLCKTSFETPNPLKIHLATACGQQKIDVIWIRLHYSLSHHQAVGQSEPVPPSTLSSHSATNSFRTFSPSNVTDDDAAAAYYHLRSSAFHSVVSHHHHHHRRLQSTGDTALPALIHQTATETDAHTDAIQAAAQIETIVSNMGASKQGHLCIYCGKIYSRKYGLKIHIRTHTGFKPLKCKFCLRPFGDPSNLNKHVRLHMQAGSPIFKCHLCHKVVIRRRDLQRHLQTRHRDENRRRFGGKEETSSSEDY